MLDVPPRNDRDAKAMRIVVPAVSEDCPAALALRIEGVEFEIVLMEHDYSYSDMFTRLWKEGEGFVSIEHDIASWPGAIDKISDCHEPWCSYEYPLSPGFLTAALGFTKVSGRIVQAYPVLWKIWDNKPWSNLDGSVCPALEAVAGRTHIHTPPVAHVKS